MKPRILIVDDEPAITRQLLWTLTEDYDVLIAHDLPSAVRHATIYEPAVAIVDLYLPPEVDSPEIGLKVLEYIKAHVPDSKLVAMAATNGPQTRKSCYAAGADDFLAKPFETELLLATMRRMAPRRLHMV